MTESELLTRIAEGDEHSFLELYNRWQPTVYRFAFQMTGSIPMAEEITQDVFLLLIRKEAEFRPERGNFSSFIYGVARNLSFRALRKNRRYHGILNVFSSQRIQQARTRNPLTELSEEEATTTLRRCILSLPSRYREVIVLCDLHELSYEQAASITKTAIGTVRSRLHRGRELLAQKMRPSGQAEKQKNGGAPYELPAL
jgi:RNA polymerase sigma-70 factor (ECF subfamily)